MPILGRARISIVLQYSGIGSPDRQLRDSIFRPHIFHFLELVCRVLVHLRAHARPNQSGPTCAPSALNQKAVQEKKKITHRNTGKIAFHPHASLQCRPQQTWSIGESTAVKDRGCLKRTVAVLLFDPMVEGGTVVMLQISTDQLFGA